VSLGIPANFNRFCILAFLLHRRLSMEVNQTLHDVWLSPGLVHYIYTSLGALDPNGILPRAKFTLRPSLAFSYIGSIAERHSSSGCQPNCGMVQGMELWNVRSSSFSTEGATYIPSASITLVIGPHSSFDYKFDCHI